ncbi:HSF-type DNA-binding protein [Achlya hypogyna]|uniref:HSF-type DNA-binding protein n=1 Tax=Achlya hypogyna TaxID=1202772 RepID=A0A1V9ZTB6_ACHHY|nr:HSF-type DNA-binding protein [Achlya hypogyna]
MAFASDAPPSMYLHTGLQSVPPPMPTPKSKVKATSPRSPVKKRNVGVPKFLRFLYEILEKEDKSIISWSHKGTAFQIRKPEALSNGILPRYFKHNKVSSFQRQLNYFGFKKWTKTQTVVCTFSHPNFVHHKPENIKLIKRKERGLTDATSDASVSEPVTAVRPWMPPVLNSYDAFLGSPIDTQLDMKKQHNVALPMLIHAPYAPAPAQMESFSAEWGDVLLYAPAPLEATPDAPSYFDLWEDQQPPTTSFALENVAPAPEMQPHLMQVKHEDMMLEGQMDYQLGRFCNVAEF